jgi:ElaB/YqjD/DUF883 family membrane-anchored ribosome-binding protein
MSDEPTDANRIERDLNDTRSRLGSHLAQLQERLSPGQVVDDLMGYFRGKEGAEFGRNLLDSARANPLPVALTGIGLAWLMTSKARGPAGLPVHAAPPVPQALASGAGESSLTARLHTAQQSVTRHPGEDDDDFAARLDEARGRAFGVSRQAEETSQTFSERIKAMMSDAGKAVGESTDNLRDRVSGAAGSAGDKLGAITGTAQTAIRNASSSLGSTLAESPVLLGALGIAAGALLGALLPQSAQEEEALGGMARQAHDAAKGLVSQGKERGANVARSVLGKVEESANAHGLTGDNTLGSLVDAALSGELAANAKVAAKDVLKAGDAAVRAELPSTPEGTPPSQPQASPPSQPTTQG